MANARTLFHLVPLNDLSRGVLTHPDNKRFVSPTDDGRTGLEIGFHVTPYPGRVFTRLGRDTDLILRERNISAVHVAFEIHAETHLVLLSVRSKRASSVSITPIHLDRPTGAAKHEAIEGDCVLGYGKTYVVCIVAHKSEVRWQQSFSPEQLRELAIQEYQNALQQQGIIRSRYLPTEVESEIHTWHNTRLHSARRILFREADGAQRVQIGAGGFGEVFKAIDRESGNTFAIKTIRLNAYPDAEYARAAAHRELKTLQKLNHKNIIECLGYAKWDTGSPEIFMPLRPGSLRSLAKAQPEGYDDDRLCTNVLRQTLSALDYLDLKGLCHRDVKPENILYWVDNDKYTFQLADFGLANHQSLAFTRCGTGYYTAPEVQLENTGFPQSPKMDVWSLFATVIDIHHDFDFPPKNARTYNEVLNSIRAAATRVKKLAPMVRENPNYRASAAQMLVYSFNGEGLSRPKNKVPPIVTREAALTHTTPHAVAAEPAKAEPKPLPLVKYPRALQQRAQQQIGQAVRLKTQEQPPLLRPCEGGIRRLRQAPRPTREELLSDKATLEKDAERKLDKKPNAGHFHIPGRFPG